MRVIAGSARGRPLRAPRSQRVRPTADRVKEAMFSMLEAVAYKRGYAPTDDRPFAAALAWPRVLELYAGSGALAIEALSRGANWADLAESDPEARRTIDENLDRAGLRERSRVHLLSAEQALKRLQGPYGLVLLDPPYADPSISHLLAQLVASSLVGPESVIVLEHGKDFAPPGEVHRFRLARTRRYGTSYISLYTHADRPV